jgi:hypothetical protein
MNCSTIEIDSNLNTVDSERRVSSTYFLFQQLLNKCNIWVFDVIRCSSRFTENINETKSDHRWASLLGWWSYSTSIDTRKITNRIVFVFKVNSRRLHMWISSTKRMARRTFNRFTLLYLLVWLSCRSTRNMKILGKIVCLIDSLIQRWQRTNDQVWTTSWQCRRMAHHMSSMNTDKTENEHETI